jgi:hypothetical protein
MQGMQGMAREVIQYRKLEPDTLRVTRDHHETLAFREYDRTEAGTVWFHMPNRHHHLRRGLAFVL